jgi:hypothetical protein
MDQPTTCTHVRGSHVVPGWGCCACHVYNGYQHPNCRNCGHVSCYETESPLGKEAAELVPIGSNPTLLRRWLEEKSRKGGNREHI